MKTFKSIIWMLGCLSVLIIPLSFSALADTPAKPEIKSFTGTVKTVDLKKRTFEMQGLLKKFTVGPVCNITLPDKSTGTLNNLQAGETIMVKYHLTDGVPVADRIDIQQQVANEKTVHL